MLKTTIKIYCHQAARGLHLDLVLLAPTAFPVFSPPSNLPHHKRTRALVQRTCRSLCEHFFVRDLLLVVCFWRWAKLILRERVLLYLSLPYRALGHVHSHSARPDPAEGLQDIEHPVPDVPLWVVALHNVHHAPAVPGVAAHHVDVPIECCHAHVALAAWHRRHRGPLVTCRAVILAAQHVVVVAAASEVVATHHVQPVAHSAHAVQAAQLHHVGPPAPRVCAGVIAPQLLLESVSGDSPCAGEVSYGEFKLLFCGPEGQDRAAQD